MRVMLFSILLILIFLTAPAGVLVLCRKVKWLGKVGPVLLLYITGLIIGNSGMVTGLELPEMTAGIQDVLSSAMVPLAIPMMLLGCRFRRSETRSQLLALVTGLAAVVISVAAGYLIFAPAINGGMDGVDDAAVVGGMLTGVYTGGTINLASLKTMLAASDETYLLLNGYDMVISFLYLMFLVAAGIRLFRRFLPNETSHCDDVKEDANINPYKGLGSKKGLAALAALLGYTAVVCGLAFCITLLFPAAPFMTIFILSLTTFSIAASFIPALRNLPYSYDIGMYCIYIFSIVVASMADFETIGLAGGAGLLGYLSLVIFGSLLLQVILALIFRIDSDTMVISSVAFICSPPFVPMIAAAMHNRRVLAAGLAIGIVGYATGNYLGYMVFCLLS